MRRALLLVACLVAATPDGHARSSDDFADHAITPFELTPRGGVAVAVSIDGRGPFRLLLDTGSTHSIVTAHVAALLGARPVAQSPVQSVAGIRMLPVVAFERLSLGPQSAPVMPSVVEAMPDADEGVEGVVGQDVLAGLRYTLDFRDRRIVWHDGACVHPATGRVARLDLIAQAERFIVRARHADVEVRLVPDSASEQFVFFQTAGTVRGRPAGRLETVAGTGHARHTTIAGLVLDGIRLPPVAAVAVTRPADHPDQVDGLLPLHGFARATFDGPARLLTLELGTDSDDSRLTRH